MSKHSDSIKDLAAALALAQGEMENPVFDATNPHFKNRYASLAAVRKAIIPVLAKHGIALVQSLSTTPEGIACVTILMHSSGDWLESDALVIPASKADAQGFGSAVTYARRYALQAVAGVAGEEDDDAEGAVRRDQPQRPPAAAPTPRPVPAPVVPTPPPAAPVAAPFLPPPVSNIANPGPSGATTSEAPAVPITPPVLGEEFVRDSGPCLDCGIALIPAMQKYILNVRKQGKTVRWSHQAIPGLDKFKDETGRCNHPDILKLAGQVATR